VGTAEAFAVIQAKVREDPGAMAAEREATSVALVAERGDPAGVSAEERVWEVAAMAVLESFRRDATQQPPAKKAHVSAASGA